MFRSKRTDSTLAMNQETDETREFYNAIADQYHLFYRDWQATVDREGMTLRRELWQRKVRSVLDASCGTGTQAIALAKQGFQVTAADISPKMIEKARENAQVYRIQDKIKFVQVGFLELASMFTEPFDAILSKGNALPHLLTDAEIKAAFANFGKLLKPGGTLIIGIRNFDLLAEDRPRMVPGHFHDDPGEQHILFDIWDWDDGPPLTVTFNKFIVSGQGEDYKVKKKSVKYRALLRAELEAMLAEAGFVDVKVEQQHWELVFTAAKGE